MKEQWLKDQKNLKKQAEVAFKTCKNFHELLTTKNQLIGRNSPILKIFKTLSIEDKKKYNQELNQIKIEIDNLYQEFYQNLLKTKKDPETIQINNQYSSQHRILINSQGYLTNIGNEEPILPIKIQKAHPWNEIISLIHEFANKMNWIFVDSQDLTSVKENFTLLNISSNHPSANWKDCFYLDEQTLLRSHTTNMTAKALIEYQKNQIPRLLYTVGNVYRNDTEDRTHLWQFSQFDACLIDDNLSLAALKAILIKFSQFLFGNQIKLRFRNNYFPFTEPSIEMDMECLFCKQTGCSVCKKSSWIELLGGGIVSPEVLKKCQINSETIVLAFGIGIERLAMLKYQIKDIRKLYQNTLLIKE